MGRASGAGSLLAQLGLGTQQAGAEGLRQSGWDYSNLPMQVANQMSGMGNMLSGQDLGWAQFGGGLAGNQYAGEQQYTPSMIQQLLMGLSQTWPTSGWGGGPQPDMTGVGGIAPGGGLQWG